MRIPTWILWTFVVVSCLAGFVAAVALPEIIDATATVQAGHGRVWVHTPFVGPGDRAWLSVESDGQLRGVRVLHGTEVVGEWTGESPDSAYVDVRLPDRYGPLELVAEIDWRVDTSAPVFLFRNDLRHDAVPFEIVARPTASRWAFRVGALLLALVFWVQAAIGFSKVFPWMGGVDAHGDRNLSEAVGAALCVLIVCYVLLGYWSFILPIYAATHWVGTLPALLWMAAWIAGAPYAGYRLRQWFDRAPAHEVHAPPLDPAELARSLAVQGLEVRTVLGWMRVRDGEATLWLSTADLRRGGPTRVLRGNEPLMVRIAVVMARESPVQLRSWSVSTTVEPGDRAEDVVARLGETRRQQAEALLRQLEEMGKRMAELGKHLGIPPR
ncbi:MAG: hypothetical protein H6737_05490 [Alphaproteobacteria bacterium]|nr:hypothetical protein [Alphaproteobacteria bacterium]